MKCLVFVLAYFFLLPANAWCDIAIGEDRIISFASVEERRRIVTRRDEYVRSLSPFDRSARLKKECAVTEEEYLEFEGGNVLEWRNGEKRRVAYALQDIQKELEAVAWLLPGKVFIVKTNGEGQANHPYTRSNAIVLPELYVNVATTGHMRRLLVHELFHIISRERPALRDELYAAIGFRKCGEVKLPPELKDRRITNPDAPWNHHCIELKVDGGTHCAVPLLFSDSEKYDPNRGGDFFDYMQFAFLLVGRDDTSSVMEPVYDGNGPVLVEADQVSGFYEQVGANTDYIIHPEEILAENFVMFVLGDADLPSPHIIERMERILKEHARAPAFAAETDD